MNIAIRHHLVDLLNDAVQHTVFSRRDGGGIGADRYRLMWSDPDSVERLSGYTMKEPPGFDEFVKTVASALGPFVGEDQQGNPVVYSNIELIVAQAGFDETPLDHYCRMLLLAAVRTSPERVVDLLGLWLDGEPIPRTHVIVLGGLTMEGELSIPPHIKISKIPTIRRIPEDIQTLNEMLGVPKSLIKHRHEHVPGAISVDGRVALFHNMAMGPVFRQPTDYGSPKEVMESHPIVRSQSEYDQHIMRWSLSLACNAPVRMITGWHFTPDDDIKAFSAMARIRPELQAPDFWSTQHDRGYSESNIGRLDEESLAVACQLAMALGQNQLGERTRLALERWIRGLPTIRPSYPDQYTDLRIALERLFAPDGFRKIAFRTSTRCARFLEKDMGKREALAKRIKSFYRTASGFTHNPSVQEKKTHILDIQAARRTVRQSILKVVEEGCADPDLDLLDYR